MEAILVSTLRELPAWMLVSLGFYLAYRGLKFPDLTVDASFLAGMAATGCAAVAWASSFWGILLALLLGTVAGTLTTLIYLSNPRPAYKLLAGLLVVFAFYSINFRVLGNQTYMVFVEQPTSMNWLANYEAGLPLKHFGPLTLLLGFALLGLVVLFLAWFLRTRVGLIVRAVGSRPHILQAKHGRVGLYLLIGLAISNMIVALGGWFYASTNSNANISMWGTIIHALAAAIIGEALVERMPRIRDRRSSVWALLLAPLVGALIYQSLRALAVWFLSRESQSIDKTTISVNQQDINTLIAAAIVAVVMIVRFLAMRSQLELPESDTE